MAFIVETGEGLEFATSYVSVEFADAYHSAYGNREWTGSDEEKQVALNKASRAIDVMFGQRFASYPTYPDRQALLFPRSTFYINKLQTISSSSVPRLLKEAVCEVALLAIQDEDIYPNLAEGSGTKSEKMKLGDLEIAVEYDGTTSLEQLEGFYKVELLLAPLLSTGSIESGPYYAYMSL